jgi:methylated-DNA-[protein]-cysteine S-methyltransferase
MSGQAHHRYHVFGTDGGFCGIAWSDAGITCFQLPTSSADTTERLLLRRAAGAGPDRPPPDVMEAIASVRKYFRGETIDFSEFRLELTDQSELFNKIYEATRKVGWGQTTTYGSLAKSLGEGWEVARNVGQAMAKNPVPLIIPCHRVLAAGNKLGGFSAPGGAMSKARMLELEGTRPEPPRPKKNSGKSTRQSTLAF